MLLSAPDRGGVETGSHAFQGIAHILLKAYLLTFQRMNTLRLEAEDAQEKVEELKGKVKTMEQENLAKEQEITSLNHRNQLLENEVEKMESSLKEAKDAANQSAQHDTQNEALQRRLQILEEEAEEADRTLRETNEKYD